MFGHWQQVNQLGAGLRTANTLERQRTAVA